MPKFAKNYNIRNQPSRTQYTQNSISTVQWRNNLGRCKDNEEKQCMCAKSLWSFLTLCNPRYYNLPGFSVHWIFQARILEWVATPSSRESSCPRNQTHISYGFCIAGRYLPLSHQGKPKEEQQQMALLLHCYYPERLTDENPLKYLGLTDRGRKLFRET